MKTQIFTESEKVFLRKVAKEDMAKFREMFGSFYLLAEATDHPEDCDCHSCLDDRPDSEWMPLFKHLVESSKPKPPPNEPTFFKGLVNKNREKMAEVANAFYLIHGNKVPHPRGTKARGKQE